MIEVSPEKRLTLKEVNRHPWVIAGGKGEMDLEDPMMEVVQTHIIPSDDTIDADVIQAMNSLGCFKDKEKLKRELLKAEHNTEKVIYFLLLDRKKRKPSYEDDTEVMVRARCGSQDPPRKRIDHCKMNGVCFSQLSTGSPVTPRRNLYSPAPRRRELDYLSGSRTPLLSNRRRQPSGSSLSSTGVPSLVTSPAPDSPFPSPKVQRHQGARPSHQPELQSQGKVFPVGSDTDQLLPTPPGSPSAAHWRSRLNSLKNNFLGSPRFHRRKMHVPEETPGYHPTPESSPELTKRSWFGSLMSTEKDESYTVVVKGKALASIKADLIHAFLSVSDLQHSVLSPVSFRLEYKRGSTAPAMFQRQVRMQVDLSPVSTSETPSACLHAITFTLISGNIRRFRRICEHIQSMVCASRRCAPPASPRAQRRAAKGSEMSESSSCGSDTSERLVDRLAQSPRQAAEEQAATEAGNRPATHRSPSRHSQQSQLSTVSTPVGAAISSGSRTPTPSRRGSRESNGAGSLARRESGKSVKSQRGSGSVTPVRDLEIPPFRDPETRAKSEARTNGTTVSANLKNVEDADEPEEEVALKVNGNSSPNGLKPLPTKDLNETKEEKSNNNDLEARPAQCV